MQAQPGCSRPFGDQAKFTRRVARVIKCRDLIVNQECLDPPTKFLGGGLHADDTRLLILAVVASPRRC